MRGQQERGNKGQQKKENMKRILDANLIENDPNVRTLQR